MFCVLDLTTKQQAALVRMAGATFDSQLVKLRSLWMDYGQPGITAEYNSMGGPLVERMQVEGLPVTGFVTTASSKHAIITALELAFDNREITLLNDPTQTAELLAYEKKERVGIPYYGAPAGMHDDTVIALALAWNATAGNSWHFG